LKDRPIPYTGNGEKTTGKPEKGAKNLQKRREKTGEALGLPRFEIKV